MEINFIVNIGWKTYYWYDNGNSSFEHYLEQWDNPNQAELRVLYNNMMVDIDAKNELINIITFFYRSSEEMMFND